MIRGRTIYVVALIAIVSSLIISGCVTAPPKVPSRDIVGIFRQHEAGNWDRAEIHA